MSPQKIIAVVRGAANSEIQEIFPELADQPVGAHAVATDPSNRFAFVPHIARLQDNVLEPTKNNPSPNVILQYWFDAQTGRLSPNTPPRGAGGSHLPHYPEADGHPDSGSRRSLTHPNRHDGRIQRDLVD